MTEATAHSRPEATPKRAPALLEVHSLSKSYGARPVVRDVSLSVEAGEIVGLLGPNGAGKTTSFYMIVGLVGVDQGAVHLDGRDITHTPIDRRAHLGLGYLPQEPSVFRKLTVRENILAILELRRDLDRATRRRALDELLEELHITHIADSKGQSLSGGERRRVEIARALAANPRAMLLDEPFAGIDPISVIDIQRIIEHLRDRGIGVLITDHNVRETLGVCKRAYIVSDGTILAHGTAEQLLANQSVRDVYLGHDFTL
ncbi:LPS export ABC transporter ATP-binding protein [Guyparkeria halophila]|uniref:LPS export ABC transporter ATP-binding protein n=1 Tax=Guyparkeria halophila TaxID=47960 RepID=A0ABZ0YTT7_9GAMM|nr:LPS export ABC transporter ATP-binding protein [Guyparkeria halophila]WQH15569.1 LPS export ABC transporter ATP-binding protein [Guyparkeria halophila]